MQAYPLHRIPILAYRYYFESYLYYDLALFRFPHARQRQLGVVLVSSRILVLDVFKIDVLAFCHSHQYSVTVKPLACSVTSQLDQRCIVTCVAFGRVTDLDLDHCV